MIISWSWVLLALVLLGPPPVLSAQLRRVVASVRRNASLGVISLLRPWQNWLDLARAAVGTLVVTQLAILPASSENSQRKALLAQVSFLGLALILQVIRIDTKTSRAEQRVQLLAPVFYICGLTLVLSGLSGAFAVFVGWIFAFGSKNPAYQLPAMAVGLVAGGYVFSLSLPLLYNLALIALPFCGAFVLRRKLVFVGTGSRFSEPVLTVS